MTASRLQFRFGFVSFLRLAGSVLAYLLVVSTILPMVDRATTPVSEPGNSQRGQGQKPRTT